MPHSKGNYCQGLNLFFLIRVAKIDVASMLGHGQTLQISISHQLLSMVKLGEIPSYPIAYRLCPNLGSILEIRRA